MSGLIQKLLERSEVQEYMAAPGLFTQEEIDFFKMVGMFEEE